MCELDLVRRPALLGPGWVFAAILSGFAVLNTILFSLSAPDWLEALLIGAWAFEPMLLATWTALGPGWLFLKLPLAIPALLLVFAAPGLGVAAFQDFERFDFILMAIAGTAILAATTGFLLVLRSFVGWRIEQQHDLLNSVAMRPQFNTKYLITLVTLCAAALGIICNLTFSPPKPMPFFGPSFVIHIIIFGGATIAAALLPVIAVPLSVLSPYLTKRMSGWSLAFWALTTGAINLIWAALGHLDVFPFVLLVQLGAAIAGVIVALVLRLAGFRIIRSQRRPTHSLLTSVLSP